jgi:hypothetical protein
MCCSSSRLIAIKVSSTYRRFGKMFFLLACGVALFSTSSTSRAVSPPPDGDYGNGNTAEGANALESLPSGGGVANTAIGSGAMLFTTFGDHNTAVGDTTLYFNQLGSFNTAVGSGALDLNNGSYNTATGDEALISNTTGTQNTAIGASALALNQTGNFNTASGYQALFNNKTAAGNTATGFNALLNNVSGINNTGVGRQALQNNKSSFNIGLGNLAGRNLTTGSNNIDIGNQGVAAEAKTIRIGEQGNQQSTFIAGISGVAVTGPAVHVNTSGQLGIMPSSARFKEAIKPMDKASEAILDLKPVTFRYKEEVDPDKVPQFGLVAEEVEKVDPQLVVHDDKGKPFTVRYEAVNAMLLNEFLKEHSKVEQQEAKLSKQETTIAQQQKQIDALTTGLQKVTAAVELNKARPTQVADNR